ncbi:MAG: DNA methyltransferase, partial [Methanomassiliicoccales archaeon]
EGDVVLDPFSGAGTTCSVAKQLRRKYIGIEMSQKYFDTSEKRLREVVVLKQNKSYNDESKSGEAIGVLDWME